jgi:hypothetical protein
MKKIKYNIVVGCYDKILVNVAAYVILHLIIQNIMKYMLCTLEGDFNTN